MQTSNDDRNIATVFLGGSSLIFGMAITMLYYQPHSDPALIGTILGFVLSNICAVIAFSDVPSAENKTNNQVQKQNIPCQKTYPQ